MNTKVYYSFQGVKHEVCVGSNEWILKSEQAQVMKALYSSKVAHFAPPSPIWHWKLAHQACQVSLQNKSELTLSNNP